MPTLTQLLSEYAALSDGIDGVRSAIVCGNVLDVMTEDGWYRFVPQVLDAPQQEGASDE